MFSLFQIPRLSNNANQQSAAANMQSELLARSGFQPYRPDERHLHPAGAPFTMDSFSPFGHIPGLAASKNRTHQYKRSRCLTSLSIF